MILNGALKKFAPSLNPPDEKDCENFEKYLKTKKDYQIMQNIYNDSGIS